MFQLQTKVVIPKPDFQINYGSKIYFTGSCFAENIGNRFKRLKFNVCINPFGVQFNPLAICNSIRQLLTKDSFGKDDLLFENELWFSFSHYTQFSDTSQQSCLDKINSRFSFAKQFIRRADVIVITLGTSWAYFHKNDGEIVSNCHKLPANRFDRKFINSDESYQALKLAIEDIRKINTQARFIFTVSPIRHWKDGAIENQRSKSALLLAVALLENELTDVFYFPSYEIMMDELRDYRFYAGDMIHPSDQATEYIKNRFLETFFDLDHLKKISEIQQLKTSLEHRPIHTGTHAYKKFLASLLSDIDVLSKKYPNLDFTEELQDVTNREI